MQCFVKEIHFCRVLTSLIKHLAFCICLRLFLLRVFCLVHVYIFCYLFIFVFLSSIRWGQAAGYQPRPQAGG